MMSLLGGGFCTQYKLKEEEEEEDAVVTVKNYTTCGCLSLEPNVNVGGQLSFLP